MTKETLLLLLGLLNQQSLPVGVPDFEAAAARLSNAKRELAEAITMLDHAAADSDQPAAAGDPDQDAVES